MKSAGIFCALPVMVGMFATPTVAASFTVLYNFSGGSDGAQPQAGLLRNASGTLYGTTAIGGSQGKGTVFKFSGGILATLYVFQGVPDGANPYGGVAADKQLNLYGTTLQGGSATGVCAPYGCGTVFKVTPAGAETVLHRFTTSPDGAFPKASPYLTKDRALYLTTSSGGIYAGGTVFTLPKKGAGSNFYNFGNPALPDGLDPEVGLVPDGARDLITTTNGGFNCSNGTLLSISPIGAETVLHEFCGETDGSRPLGTPTLDATGNIYGTTFFGPNLSCCGTIYEQQSTGGFITLYWFPGSANSAPQGNGPLGGVVRDRKGNLYGTTSTGGSSDEGTLFRLSPSGVLTVLHNFDVNADGASPMGNLVMDGAGNLYGTTSLGGTSDSGIIYELTTKAP
jgi:uncharacterized repeat protein (TIGR03803 family)